jgi:hypothetical protein
MENIPALGHFGTLKVSRSLKLQDVFDYAVGKRAFPGDI